MKDKTRFYVAVSILVGTAIGAGILGIPYVSAQAGFFVALAYIVALGLIIMAVNLYLGEVALRTKEKHQIAGYSHKYFGKPGKLITQFAVVFGIYSALIAYMLGIGESLSFLIFDSLDYSILFGVLTGAVMSGLLFGGLNTLKNSEKIGVSVILFLLALIFLIFFKDVQVENLLYFNLSRIFLPFGVVLFALLSFHAIPEIKLVLKKKEKLMKPVLIIGGIIAILFYSAFAFIVTGSQGLNTPEVATLALGSVFVLLGILTMFTSYLALGNALLEDFEFDEKFGKKKAWFFASIVPVFIFIFIKTIASEFFSFTKILAIGGVVSGGIIAVMSLLMVKQAKKHGNRRPEYSIPANWIVIILLSLIFISGVVIELFF